MCRTPHGDMSADASAPIHTRRFWGGRRSGQRARRRPAGVAGTAWHIRGCRSRGSPQGVAVGVSVGVEVSGAAGGAHPSEPTYSLTDQLTYYTQVAVALDETVDAAARHDPAATQALASLTPADGVVAWVIKPGALGGVERTLTTAAQAHACGVEAVLSSAFESSVGLADLTQLAAAVDARAELSRCATSRSPSQSVVRSEPESDFRTHTPTAKEASAT